MPELRMGLTLGLRRLMKRDTVQHQGGACPPPGRGPHRRITSRDAQGEILYPLARGPQVSARAAGRDAPDAWGCPQTQPGGGDLLSTTRPPRLCDARLRASIAVASWLRPRPKRDDRSGQRVRTLQHERDQVEAAQQAPG